MRPVQISFGGTRWWQRLLGRGPWWQRAAFSSALLLSALLLGWAVWQGQEAALRQEQLQHAIKKAQATPAKPVMRPQRATIPAETLRQMDAATARLNWPWSEVLDIIERGATRQVALLALEPDARSGSVNLTAEARTLDDLLAYAEALGRDSAVASVRLGHHEVLVQEPGQPVRMVLSVNPTRFRQ